MNEVFMIFLSLSLSGSLIALLLYLLKPLYKSRLTKTWQYYIFLIVILRLFIPFSPEVSLVSIILNKTGSYFSKDNILLMDMSEFIYTTKKSPPEILPEQESSLNSSNNLSNITQIASEVLWLLWLVPAIFLLLRKIVGYNRVVRLIKIGCTKIDSVHVMDIYLEVCRAMKIKHPPDLAQNENIAAPMLVGVIRPVIVLSDTGLRNKELYYILQHELIHYRRFDIIYKWLAQIMVCLHWYNPLVYWVHREIIQNCELSCDEAIISRLNEGEKNAYGDMLLETIKLNKNFPIPVVSAMLNEDTKLIKERLIAIMKFKKSSKISTVMSLVLAAFFLCIAVYTGVYAQTNETPANSISENNGISAKEIPDIMKYDHVPALNKLQFGPYELDMESTYFMTISWQGGSDTLQLILAGTDDYQKEYTLLNGKSLNIDIPKDGSYYFYSPPNRKTGDMQTLSIKFYESGVSAPVAPAKPVTPTKSSENTQTVVYESVEMRRYEQASGSIPAHPYIHDIKTNNTNKKITEHQSGMLAYDRDGKPLKIDWFSMDSESDSSFYFLYDWGEAEILPGSTYDVFGGWSLNIKGNDPLVSRIAYVLYCDKEITFEDGTVWKNPDFEDWRKTYEGKTIDVKVLKSYYPYVQRIVF